MEINKDEAIRSLSIAKNHYGNGNYTAAVRFAQKSINLYPTEAARLFLVKAQEARACTWTTSSAPPPKKPPSSPKTTPEPQPQVPSTPKKMHTSEQVDIVKSILECGTDYYKVLSLKRNCTDIQIKKAYRKLALQLHPDKNSAPGADEAFKLISKSFAVLSDPQKRAIHDANGGDPEQRGSASSWCSVHRYEDDISPEDLFNMFFGPAGTAVTDGSGFCSATFVGPGFTPHTYYRSSSGSAGHSAPSHHHQHHHNHQEWIRSSASKTSVASSRSSGAIAILFQILPLVILFGYSLFSGLFADYSATATSSSSPAFSLKPTPLFTQARVTQRYQVPYYVNPSAFRPMEGNQFCLSRVEQQVEIDWMRSLQNACQHERRERATRMNAASGTIFGIGRNEEQYQAALKMPLTSCEQARQYGYVYR